VEDSVKSSHHRRFVCLLAILGVSLAVLACSKGGKLTQANYQKVTTGMSQTQVEEILGPGTEQASSGVDVPPSTVAGVTVPGIQTSSKVLTWQEGGKLITITFVDYKVTAKAQVGL
jgi:hypothetical protein